MVKLESVCSKSQSNLFKNDLLINVIHRVSLMSYLVVRCHNIYDAQDILKQAQLLLKNKTEKKSSRLIQFKNVIKLLNNSTYKTQFKQLNSINMENELKQVGMNNSNFWIQIKKNISAKVYDTLWLFYIEKFQINEISFMLDTNRHWVKLVVMLNKGKFPVKYKQHDLLNLYLLKV